MLALRINFVPPLR